MTTISSSEALRLAAQWAVMNEQEIYELRNTPVQVKFRQLATLMQSLHLFPSSAERLSEDEAVQERWGRIRAVLK